MCAHLVLSTPTSSLATEPSPSSPSSPSSSSSVTGVIDTPLRLVPSVSPPPVLGPLSSQRVLVLGSGGLIGSHLVKWLHDKGYTVLEVKNRLHVDLRKPEALNHFPTDIAFAFFLACEVGGSKFIDSASGNTQLDIIEYNIQIYQSVFPWFSKHRIPFIFTSSYLQAQPTSYGTVKRLGEAWMKALGVGKIVRLWNIYGAEKPGVKSHVLTDWISACLATGKIQSLTDGSEARQFIHASDCAAALGMLMERYEDAEFVTDISSDHWITLRQLAEYINEAAPQNITCQISFSDVQAVARARLSPKTNTLLYQIWEPSITLPDGIRGMWDYYTSQPIAPLNPTDLPGRWMREGEGISHPEVALPPDVNIQVKVTAQDHQIDDMENIAL